ncbi:NAD-dependent epimerase/dehydratase family protein [Xylanibacillus composti]|uniref:Epimerase n=1 Tax=Xylanibacillus composti TaxID=1572762 RepID=A0A8J4M333_9BACL|nr:NAD-dependent epimerase/dehydratase family protein [Xylanibacillus composti]MDT9726391.1 NAD-dependent epimerase/dehydratase family protein [Xylanibacillus composti]GIQ70369.1 epimerase [Xylanibacillus composti]
MKKKVLITGSNGVLGRNLVEYLAKRHRNDYELVLFDQVQSAELARDYEARQGDIRNAEEAAAVMRGVDMVVHTASASPSYPDHEIYDIIINGTKTLMEEAFRQKVSRFVYISSTSVYGVPEKSPIYEDDEVKPYDPYNKGKIAAEKLCAEWRGKGKCVTVLRPRSFIGPYRLGTFGILYEWAQEGRHFPMLGKGQNQYQLLDVEDLCQAIELAMCGDPDQVNDLFNIGAKHFTTLKQDYQAVLDAAGHGKRIISLPAKPMMAVLGVLEKLKLSPFYKRLYLKLNRNYYVSIEKAERQLGYRPRYSNQEALVRNYHWYLANRDSSRQQGNSNNAVWNQGILKLAKIFF